MSAIEDGTVAGPGLSAIQTVMTFIVIPVALFFVIASLSWIASAPRNSESESAITAIE